MGQSFSLYAKLFESRVSFKLDPVTCVSFFGVVPTIVDWLVWYISFPSYLQVVCRSISNLCLLSSVENCRSVTFISYTCIGETAKRPLENAEHLLGPSHFHNLLF